jgi:hypothetical protein
VGPTSVRRKGVELDVRIVDDRKELSPVQWCHRVLLYPPIFSTESFTQWGERPVGVLLLPLPERLRSRTFRPG